MMETKKQSLKSFEDGCSEKIKRCSIPPIFFCLFYICVSVSTYDKKRNDMDILFWSYDKADFLIF